MQKRTGRSAVGTDQGVGSSMKFITESKSNRWLVLDQSFFAMFITFSLIELANVGAGLIDGLIVSNFLSAEAMAAAGIAHPIFSISGIFGGLFATGMQTLCTRELGRGDVRAFNRLFSAVMILGTVFSAALTVVLCFRQCLWPCCWAPREKVQSWWCLRPSICAV